MLRAVALTSGRQDAVDLQEEKRKSNDASSIRLQTSDSREDDELLQQVSSLSARYPEMQGQRDTARKE